MISIWLAVAVAIVGAEAPTRGTFWKLTHHSWRHGLGDEQKCACDPVGNPSAEVTCTKRTHSCFWNNHNHKEMSTSPTVGSRFWWGGPNMLNTTCDGHSTHESIQVSHSEATGLGSDDRGGAVHGKLHDYHHCKMVSADECSCCDCDRPRPPAPHEHCWSEKVHGEMAWQGPGPGFDAVAAAGTQWRKDHCVLRGGLNEEQCRQECEATDGCEAIYFKDGGDCTLALVGCMNRGCAVDIPLGSNPYRNGCYHSASSYAFVTSHQIAQQTGGAGSSFTQLRTLPDGAGLCANETTATFVAAWDAARAAGTNGADSSASP